MTVSRSCTCTLCSVALSSCVNVSYSRTEGEDRQAHSLLEFILKAVGMTRREFDGLANLWIQRCGEGE